MGAPDWRDVHDAARFEEQLGTAAKDPENAEFRLAALGRLALEEWELGRAEQILQRLATPSGDKCDLMVRLADRFRVLGDDAKTRAILEAARAVAGHLERPWQRADVLASLAEALARASDLRRARDLWEEAVVLAMQDEAAESQEGVDSGSVLGKIAEGMSVAGFGPRALEIAGRLRHPGKQERCRQRVAAVIALRVVPRPKA